MSLKIVIEGKQGAGKTTLARKLQLFLNHNRYVPITEEHELTEEERALMVASDNVVFIETKQVKG